MSLVNLPFGLKVVWESELRTGMGSIIGTMERTILQSAGFPFPLNPSIYTFESFRVPNSFPGIPTQKSRPHSEGNEEFYGESLKGKSEAF
ncbi:unnamed protein product [Allacma fusca]|uniref:Uncharacterized protein n=1 Tax=Allacma fusca TaxID=39272 RepID=A0A8J2KNA0_9HEXA|nr:unnamed protein product [Allacma fusca]